MNKKSTGSNGENIAANFLKNKGFRILHKNWRYKHKEIDIIAENDKIIIFAEVKTRKTDLPYNTQISSNKEKNILDAAHEYINIYKIDKPVRFDVILIVMSKKIPKIIHIENAFFPEF